MTDNPVTVKYDTSISLKPPTAEEKSDRILTKVHYVLAGGRLVSMPCTQPCYQWVETGGRSNYKTKKTALDYRDADFVVAYTVDGSEKECQRVHVIPRKPKLHGGAKLAESTDAETIKIRIHPASGSLEITEYPDSIALPGLTHLLRLIDSKFDELEAGSDISKDFELVSKSERAMEIAALE